MACRGARIGLVCLLAVGMAGVAALGQSNLPEPREVKGPFRIVRITADQVPKIVAAAEGGSLVRLEPAAFDALIAPRPRPGIDPTVTEARYRATAIPGADGDADLVGTAEWKVRNPQAGAGSIELDLGQVAIRSARWSDGETAVLYKAPGQARPRLWVPAAGDRTLNLEWSARGLAEPGEVRFDLRFPMAAVSAIELELPERHVLQVTNGDAVVAGPGPVEGGKSAWHVGFGGLPRLDLSVRRPTDAAPVTFFRTTTSQTIREDGGTARYELVVEAGQAGVSQLTLEHDAALTPTAVTANNLARWEPAEGAGPTRKMLLTWREPIRSGAVVVSGVFIPPLAPTAWSSPGLWVAQGINRGESLRIDVAAPVAVQTWDGQDFRLRESRLAAERVYRLEAEPRFPAAGRGVMKRPTATLARTSSTRWRTTQRIDWVAAPTGHTATATTRITLVAGTLSAAAFRLPAGWTVERVEAGGADPSWGLSDDAAGTLLRVELGRPMKAGDAADLTVSLRHPFTNAPVGVPDLFPWGADGRDGTLTVHPSGALDAWLSDIGGPELAAGGPIGGGEARRVLGPNPLSATQASRERAAQFTSAMEIDWAGPTAPSRVQLTVRPTLGAVSEVLFWSAPPTARPWVWRDEAGRTLGEAAPVSLGPFDGWAVMPPVVGRPWRLRFTRPIDRPTVAVSEWRPRHAGSVPVGLPRVAGHDFEGSLWVPDGLPFVASPESWVRVPSQRPAGRRFRYWPIAEADRRPLLPSGPRPGAANATLTTQVFPDGSATARFHFQMRHWGRDTLPIGLPAGAHDVHGTVAGRPISGKADGQVLSVPVPASGAAAIEVTYQLSPIRRTGGDVSSPLPTLPFDVEGVRRVWHVSPAWRVFGRPPGEPVPGTGADDRDAESSLITPGDARVSGPARPLGIVLAQQYPGQSILIDKERADAVRELGPTSEPLGLWLAARDLAVVTTPAGLVLTSDSQWRAWTHATGDEGPLPASIERALGEAVLVGRDASGRFLLLQNGLVNGPADTTDVAVPHGWSAWEAGDPSAESLRVIGTPVARAAVWGAAGLFAIAWISLRGRPRVAVLLAWGAALVAARGLWPAGWEAVVPTIAALVAAGLGQAILTRRPKSVPTPRPIAKLVRPGSRTTTVVALVLASVAIAADGASLIVYRVVDREGRPTEVLAPTGLIESLRNARKSGPAPPPVVITSATYRVALDAGDARVRAEFDLYQFDDAPAPLTVPIGGARVRSIHLDGSEAVVVESAADGLRLTVRGKGPHRLAVQFAVGAPASGEGRDVRLAMADAPIARLLWESRVDQRPRFGNRRGAARPAQGDLTGWDVDLGLAGAASVQVTGPKDGKGPTTRVTHAALWQLLPGRTTVTSIADYRVSSGRLGACQLAVPADLEVSRVAVRGESGAPGGSPVRLRDWALTPGADGRPGVLHVDLAQPVADRVIVAAEFVSANPIGHQADLMFPAPLGAGPVDSWAAVASQGFAIQLGSIADLEAVAEPAFSATWSSLGGESLATKPVAAYRVVSGRSGKVSVTAGLPPEAQAVSETASWWVEPSEVVIQGESRWTTGPAGLSRLAWQLPAGFSATRVVGRNLVSWSQAGNRVTAWLDQNTTDPQLGWRAVRRGPAAEEISVGPCGYSVPRVNGQYRVHVPIGWTLEPVGRITGNRLAAEGVRDIAWSAANPQPTAFRLVPPATRAEATASTHVQGVGDRLQATMILGLTDLPPGRAANLSVTVVGAGEAEVRLTPAAGGSASAVPADGGNRRWDVALPAGVDANAVATLVIASPPGMASWPMPRVFVRTQPGLPVPLSAQVQVDPDGLAVDRGDPSAVVVRRTGLASGETARGVRQDIQAARHGERWTFLGRFRVSTTDAQVLQVVAGPDTQLRELRVDQSDLADATARFVVGAGEHVIDVVWDRPEPIWEPIEIRHPRGAFTFPVADWTVCVPPGSRAVGTVPRSISTHGRDDLGRAAVRDAFTRGVPHNYQVSAGDRLAVRIEAEGREPRWPLILGGILVAVWGVLMLRWPSASTPEQCLAVAGLGAVQLGTLPYLIGALAAIVVGLRIWQWAHRPRPHPSASALSAPVQSDNIAPIGEWASGSA